MLCIDYVSSMNMFKNKLDISQNVRLEIDHINCTLQLKAAMSKC